MRFSVAYPKISREGGDFWYKAEKCPRCKKHCSRSPNGYEGMPPKKFSKIQNDFFDTVCMSTFLFFNFEKILFSNLKIELYENAADKHSGKGKSSNTVPMLWNFSVLTTSVYK